MSFPKKLVLFDFNGTIIDDNDSCWKAIEGIFYHYKKEPPTVEEYYQVYKTHWKEVFAWKGIVGTPEDFNKIYSAILEPLYQHVEPFPNVRETLTALKERGHILGIISHGIKERNAPALERHGLSSFFDPRFVQYGNKGKRDAIEAFSQIACINKEYCYYVGDAPSDVTASNSAGVQSVAFLPGFVPEYLMHAKNPTHTIRTMGELLAIT